jgi:hypothetical protein
MTDGAVGLVETADIQVADQRVDEQDREHHPESHECRAVTRDVHA